MSEEELILLSEVAGFLDTWYFDVVGDECQAHADQLLAKLNSTIVQNLKVPTEIETDPNAVHINMLRGTIAKPSIAQIIHIYGREAIEKGLAP